MTKWIFVFLFGSFTICVSLFPQAPSYLKAEADSLQLVIASESDPLEKAKAMADLSGILKLFQPDSAVALAQAAIDLGDQEDSDLIRAIGWKRMGNLHVNGIGGTSHEGANLLKQATRVFEEENKWKELAVSLGNLGFCLVQIGEVDSANKQVNRGVEIAREHNEPGAAAICLKTASLIMMYQSRFEEADSLIDLQIELAKRIGNREEQYKGLNLKNTINAIMGNYSLSLNVMFEGLRIAKEDDNPYQEGLAYRSIAQNYSSIMDFRKANQYAHRAIALLEKEGSLQELQRTYLFLGGTYLDLENPDSAVIFLRKGLDMNRTQIHDNVRSGFLINICEAYIMLGKLDLALKYTDSTDQSIGSRKVPNLSSGNTYRKATIYYKKGNRQKAIRYATESLDLAQSFQRNPQILQASALLYEAYKDQGNYRKALEMHELLKEMKEKTLNEDNIRDGAQAEEEYKAQLRITRDSLQAAIRVKDAESLVMVERARTDAVSERNVYLLIGLFLLVALAGVALYLYLVTRRQNGRIAAQKAEVEKAYSSLKERDWEKQLLLKEIHHRVKNNLQIISSLLELQSIGIDDPTAQGAMADGQYRVKAMALIHEKLYQTENLAMISFKEYATQLLNQIRALFPNGQMVQCKVLSDQISLDIDTAIPIGLILSELITNAFKYGTREPEQGSIEVALNRLDKDGYHLRISDNGEGFPPDFDLEKAASLGMRLVRNLARQLYGSVEYANDGGAVFSVLFQGTAARKLVE